jgi:hypothetical protein
VDIGDFLHLQRALQRQRIHAAAAQIQHVPRIDDFAAMVLISLSCWRISGDLRHAAQFFADFFQRRDVDGFLFARSGEGHAGQRRAIWVEKALVEATPISGPASVCSTMSDSRSIVLSIVLTMERIFCFWRLQ